MPPPFSEDAAPQPPKVLKTPAEIFSNLRQLQESHDPLIISFPERRQRFQTYVVEINRERGMMALDEMTPNDGERFLANGETFNIEGFHDGVRISWTSPPNVKISDFEGSRCYWSSLPTEVIYHQRRNAYRAPIKSGQLLSIELAGDKLPGGVKGQLLDISATGCKLRFQGDICSRLQPGQIYERLTVKLPFGAITTGVELRHLHYQEKPGTTYAGLRFYRMEGQAQRQIERYVYQLQRDSRRPE